MGIRSAGGGDNQFGRRNLADIDRISLARKKAEILQVYAAAKRNATLKKGNSVPAELPKRDPIDTRKELAKSAGVGERTFDAGKLILDAAAICTLAGGTWRTLTALA